MSKVFPLHTLRIVPQGVLIIASNTKYNFTTHDKKNMMFTPISYVPMFLFFRSAKTSFVITFFSVEGIAISHSFFQSRLASNEFLVSLNLVSLSSFHLGNILLLDIEFAVGYSFRMVLETVPISFGLPGFRQLSHLSWCAPKSNTPFLHLLSGYLPCLQLSEV